MFRLHSVNVGYGLQPSRGILLTIFLKSSINASSGNLSTYNYHNVINTSISRSVVKL